VEDAVGLLDALGIYAVHWIGLSMGGMIGQGFALNHADRLRALALCDTTAVIPEEAQPVWQERIEAARQNGMQALVQSTLERWFTPAYLEQNSPQVEHIRNLFLTTPITGFVGCSEAIRRLDYLDRLAEIELLTLIMVGEEDPGTPVAASETMHDRIQGSRLVVLPSAAHLSNVEQAEAFNQALHDFLKVH
jgi:3-oxoadipate enol-lactonase